MQVLELKTLASSDVEIRYDTYPAKGIGGCSLRYSSEYSAHSSWCYFQVVSTKVFFGVMLVSELV